MTRHIAFRAWRGADDLAGGVHQGTTVRGGELVFGVGGGTRRYADPHRAGPDGGVDGGVLYEWAAWLSGPVAAGFPVTSLVPSWNASTPAGTWLEVEVRFSPDGVRTSRWYVLGRWAEGDDEIHPTSVPGQDDDLARVLIDVLDTRDTITMSTYQLRVTLLRRPGSEASPRVRLLGVMASNIPPDEPVETSPGGGAWGLELEVPAYSQQLHRGTYPQWDSGGESWCSPTSTTMVLGRWGLGPGPEEYAWVEPAHPDRAVVHAARHVFDHSYAGAGNWSFNTAYAARYGTTAFVTRLRSLTEAEQFVRAGIPLVATVSFRRAELAGAGYDTEGHLLTIVGFDEAGNVISNDPASHELRCSDEVRAVYDRAQFERVWLGSAGGIVYVIHPATVPLPDRPAEPNW